jgi:hypothetical protein
LETTQITRLSIDWLYQRAFPVPYIEEDKNGLVKLKVDEPNSRIYYSFGNRLPTDELGILYESPIRVERTERINFKAYGDNHQESSIQTDYIGTSVYQKPISTDSIYNPGLIYRVYECEIKSTSEINEPDLVDSGMINNFSLEATPMKSNFAIIFDGFFYIGEKGVYTFYLESNDGSVLLLNDHLLIDNDGAHAEMEKKISTSLLPGYHKISVKYFQQGGGKELNVKWKGPGFSLQNIPKSVLFH